MLPVASITGAVVMFVVAVVSNASPAWWALKAETAVTLMPTTTFDFTGGLYRACKSYPDDSCIWFSGSDSKHIATIVFAVFTMAASLAAVFLAIIAFVKKETGQSLWRIGAAACGASFAFSVIAFSVFLGDTEQQGTRLCTMVADYRVSGQQAFNIQHCGYHYGFALMVVNSACSVITAVLMVLSSKLVPAPRASDNEIAAAEAAAENRPTQ